MADYPLLAVLSTGNPGEVNTSNFGKIPKLKVTDALDVTNSITVGGTVDGVDIATLGTSFSTHDGGTARAQHSAIGDHTHASAGAEGGTIDHGALTGRDDDDHTIYSKADGTRAFSGEVAGVTPTVDASLATKSYVDTVAAGLKAITSVRARTQGNVNLSAPGATIDGVTMSVDERFLADQQSTPTQDGVYLFKGGATPAVRSVDVPTGKAMAGVFTFVEEGDTDADVGYVCTNDKGSDIVGTDNLAFTTFSTPGTYTGGDGIDITTLTVSVDLATDPGLQFTSNKLDLKVRANEGLSKTSSGLGTVIEASKGLTVSASGLAGVANTAAGLELGASGFGINLQASNPSLAVVSTELGAKIYASGGLQTDSNGMGVKIDDTPDTLDVDSDGIKVVGLPATFKVNGTAVGATVTAPNLDELTDGSSSVTLHTHAVVAHLLGSASHTADTLANLNTKISDLIATYGAVRDIGVGTNAQKPAAGTAGRFFWETDTDALFYDNGATWDEIVAVAGAHDFEGSSHTACTLAEFNAANTISDKDLIGGDDSRLSDSRTPTAHDFEGSLHTACTLAEFNAADRISDKDLIASDDSRLSDDRDPNAHSTDHKHGGGDEVATATPAANAIPKAGAGNKLAAGWIQEVLAYADLTDDPIATHAALTTAVHGAGGSTLATTANIATHAAIESENAVLGHVIVETASKIDVDVDGKLTLGTHASTHQNTGSDEVGTATPGADAIIKADADSKLGSGWLDTGDITDADLSWAGKHNFNDEITVSTLLMDGAVIGPQASATIGSGGVTAGDTIKFDGTGQIIRRAANSDDANGVCTVGGAASATGWYCPFGIVEVTWESGFAPTAWGEACFLSQTGSEEMNWSTAVPTGAGKIYEGWAWGTGTSAKIFFSPRKAREIEA